MFDFVTLCVCIPVASLLCLLLLFRIEYLVCFVGLLLDFFACCFVCLIAWLVFVDLRDLFWIVLRYCVLIVLLLLLWFVCMLGFT